MAANKDFIDILREIRGSGIPGEAYTDGIWYELTIADRNSNPGIYGDILSKYGIIVEHVDTFAQAVSILEKLNVEITTLPAGSEATSALVHGVWQIGIPIGTPGIDGLDGFTPNIAISYTLGKLNCVITVDNVQVVNTTLVNLDELVNTVVNANVDVQTTLEAKQLIIDSVEIVQEITDGLDDNVANKIVELSNHTIAKLDELNAASTAEQLEIINTANAEKLTFGQSVTTKVTQYNENHIAKLAEYDANDELKIEQYNTNHTERLENLDEKYATRIIDMLNTNKILGMVDKFAVTTPTQYASFIDTNIGSYIYYLNGHMLQNIVDYTVVNDTTIELVASLSYGDIITQVDSSYIGDYLTFSGVILEERIDQPNGVAGLDENGKLSPVILTQDANNRFVTDTEKSTWNGKASTSIATTVANGLMSSTDKTKLDDILGINTGDQTTISGNAGTATKLQTPRAIQLSGAVTGTADFDGGAAINIVTTNTADPVITLAGGATGSVTLTNLSSGTLTVSIVDDSHNHVIANIDGLQTAIDAKVDDTEKGVANGIATLDANGKVVLSQINDSILGQLEYKGSWNFTTMPSSTEKGQYWIASVAGNGYEVGDWAVYNGVTFDKVDNTDAVSSVAGRTGVVVLTKTDVGLGNVDNTADSAKNVLYSTTAGAVTGQGALATLSSVNASTITDNSVGAAELNVTGNGTTSQYLRSDGDGTFTWATPTDTNTTYTAGTGLSLIGTVFANTSPNVSTNLTYTTAPTTGSVNSSDGTNATIPAATTSLAGLMTNADKSKLDGITTGANNYVHPTSDGSLHVPATSTTNNGKVLTAGATAGSLSWTTPTVGTVTTVTGTSPVVSSGGTTPAISMSAATASVNGYMTSAYASKLDGIATNANNYAHPTGDGNLHVPANGTTNNGKFLMAGATAGSLSWGVPIDTNTWRPVQNVLTSTSTTDCLSAAQGKVLNDTFASYLPLTGGTMTGTQSFTTTYNVPMFKHGTIGPSVRSDGTYLAFERGTNTGSDKSFYITGFSGGINSDSYYKSTVAAGTAPYQCTSTTLNTNLNADYLDGYHGASAATANTYALRDANADIACRLLRPNYTDQATISGALAFRTNNGADNYVRFCSDTTAIKTYLGALSTGGGTISGDLTVTGTLTETSDRRLKTNIEPILNATDKVQQLQGCTFNKQGSEARLTGVIAQDVQKVLPEAIVTDENGYLSVAYGNLVGLLIESIKELKNEIDEIRGER